MGEYILVTNWERVDKDDFYLTNEWLKENLGKEKKEIEEIKQKQKDNSLYIGYIVKAINYCIYSQMDAQQVLINEDADVLVDCESSVIDNKHEHREEYNY